MAVSHQRVSVSGGGQTMRLVESSPAQVVDPDPPQAAPEPEPPAVPVTSLEHLAALADANRDLAFKVQLKRCVRLVRIEPGKLEVSLTEDAPKTLLNDMTTRLKAWTGRNWFVSLSREQGGRTMSEAETDKRETALLDARSDPAVAAILARFPGARIIDVRIPDAVAEEAMDETSLPVEPAADDDDEI